MSEIDDPPERANASSKSGLLINEVKPTRRKKDADALLIQQYRAYIDSTEKVYDRRADTNKFFITVLTALTTLTSVVVGLSGANAFRWATLLAVPISVIGMLLCWIWIQTLRAYQTNIHSKFDIIHKIEDRLPYPIYREELRDINDLIAEREANSIGYTPVSISEMRVAAAFWFVFLFLSVSELSVFLYQLFK